jgi:hypothetical protein
MTMMQIEGIETLIHRSLRRSFTQAPQNLGARFIDKPMVNI